MKSLYKRILTIFLILMFSILIVYIVGILEFAITKKGLNRSLMLIILVGLLLVIIFICFYIFICKPIKLIEENIRNININGGNEDNNSILDILNNINNIIIDNERQLVRKHSAEMLNQKIHFAELQNQINPHFLYNTLESIRGQAIEDEHYVISNMTEALAKYFRYSISNNSDIVKLEDELKNVMNYMEIQKYRFEDKIHFQIKFDELDEELLSSSIPKLTLQPIVENAIYHGLETKENEGELIIRIEKTQKRIIIIITDDGIGMDHITLSELNKKINGNLENLVETNSKKGAGIAMSNVNKRLKLLFGKEYGLNVSSTLALGTEVEVVIPIT